MRKAVLIGFGFLTFVALASCQVKKTDLCWSTETKTQAQKIAYALLSDQVISESKATWPSNKEFTANDEKAIKELLKISLSDFHQISKNTESDSYVCGANAEATFGDDTKKMAKSEKLIIQFQVNRAEDGYVVTMNLTSGLLSIKNSLTQAINAM